MYAFALLTFVSILILFFFCFAKSENERATTTTTTSCWHKKKLCVIRMLLIRFVFALWVRLSESESEFGMLNEAVSHVVCLWQKLDGFAIEFTSVYRSPVRHCYGSLFSGDAKNVREWDKNETYRISPKKWQWQRKVCIFAIPLRC